MHNNYFHNRIAIIKHSIINLNKGEIMSDKNPVGRPSKYDPNYGQQAIDFMKDGYSVTALAGHIGVARSTIFEWAEQHQEFSDSLRKAQALAALWWENKLRDVAMTGEGNVTAAIFGVKNRSREEWRDRHEVDHSSTDGTMKPSVIEIVAPNESKG
jgi:transposase-like protein